MSERQEYEDKRKGYPVTFDNLSEEYTRYREYTVKELAALRERLDGCIDMSICNKRCPAYQPFTTMFESPERAYGGCVVFYCDSSFHKDRAPLGEACPFYRDEGDQ